MFLFVGQYNVRTHMPFVDHASYARRRGGARQTHKHGGADVAGEDGGADLFDKECVKESRCDIKNITVISLSEADVKDIWSAVLLLLRL